MEKKGQDLITSLILKTEKNQAIWNKTSRAKEFQLDFSKGRITIDLWTDEDQNELADFRMYNSNGDEIFTVVADYRSDNEDYKLIQKLNKTVSDKYYKVQETIESFIKEMSSENTIGEEIKGLDDVPF